MLTRATQSSKLYSDEFVAGSRSAMVETDQTNGRTVKKPWLSVIVPTHNGERWLGAALQSLVDQNDDGIEVIIIDGSAAEASLEIVSSFSDRLNIRAQRRLDLRSWMEK